MDQDDNTGAVRNAGPKERDDWEIPPAPLFQSGEFATGMAEKVEVKAIGLCPVERVTAGRDPSFFSGCPSHYGLLDGLECDGEGAFFSVSTDSYGNPVSHIMPV
jgi:hypothetical protein